ncbi:MAG: hypothetical protein KDK71_09715 [Chlamydiia bacterium]|nr:hypothetical protein [Chlamydiia bacterium]
MDNIRNFFNGHFRTNRGGTLVSRVIELINRVLKGWVNYFRIGNSAKCFESIRDWVYKKVRRHLMKARRWSGFGWKRWSREWIYGTLGLYSDYKIRRYS